jgi:LmbE family N-acetylglucosaminyl deacetylase
MQKVRLNEQDTAAGIGKYSVMFQLGYPSEAAKYGDDACTPEDVECTDVGDFSSGGEFSGDGTYTGSGKCAAELAEIIKACAPDFIFTHNPADKHDTHVGVMMRVLEAIRLLPGEFRPGKVYGLEVWRGLDWLSDDAKVIFDTSLEPELAEQLLSVFVSQCAGGKRYDLAALGRRMANATFLASHAVDTTNSCSYGIDITELIDNPDVAAFIGRHLDDLQNDIIARIERVCSKG